MLSPGYSPGCRRWLVDFALPSACDAVEAARRSLLLYIEPELLRCPLAGCPDVLSLGFDSQSRLAHLHGQRLC